MDLSTMCICMISELDQDKNHILQVKLFSPKK